MRGGLDKPSNLHFLNAQRRALQALTTLMSHALDGMDGHNYPYPSSAKPQ